MNKILITYFTCYTLLGNLQLKRNVIYRIGHYFEALP